MRFIAAERRRLRLGRVGTGLLFVALALVLLPFADLRVSGHDPWETIVRLGAGLLAPDFSAVENLAHATALTIAFALCGVAAGAVAGFALAPLYRYGPIRYFCIAVRSIHELFWALLLLQITGLSATTGVLALALPYTGIFAKVFSEYIDEADQRPAAAMPPAASALSVYFYARLPLALREIGVYALYRIECGLRSSAVLGFVGLPTLGYQLDTFFKQGMYGAVAAVLIIYYVMIGSIRVWMRWKLAPVYLVASVAFLATLHTPPMAPGALIRFLTEDIIPAPLRNSDLLAADTWLQFSDWLAMILVNQALPGFSATMVVAQIALVVAGLVAVLGFPLIVPQLVGRFGSFAGHIGLVIGRSTPEYMLAYILLQILGPSMLPAVIALGLHNGAIIAHLLGRQSEGVYGTLRIDAPKGLNLYAYELLPRIYGSFLALCFYRWEIIVRESAIVGLLGIATLGFYVENAIQEIRMDRVLVLLLVTMFATIAIDQISRRMRATLGIESLAAKSAAECEWQEDLQPHRA